MMQAFEDEPALPFRSHTIFGVCEGIGEDFGFNPVFLRVPFAASVLWSPMLAIGGYLVLGLVVLASRWLFPKLQSAAPQTAVQPAAPLTAANTEIEPKLPLAA
jgi:phage shock protein C